MAEEKKYLDDNGLVYYHDNYVNPRITNIINGVTPPENAGTATYATQAGKVGTATVGSATNPVYINAGVPTECTNFNVEIVDELTSTSTTAALSANQGRVLAEAFQDGCDTIVAGCTTYGETPVSNSPSDIVSAIGTIYTERYNEGVTATKKGTAGAGDVLSGKTFTNASSVAATGTMTNNGAISTALVNGSTYTIPAGYHNGSGKITVQSLANATSAADATADQILSGKIAYVDGTKVTGTMPNNGNITWKPTSSTSASYGKGYYTGITLNSSGAYNAGVAAGKVAFGSPSSKSLVWKSDFTTGGGTVDTNTVSYTTTAISKLKITGVYYCHNQSTTPNNFTLSGTTTNIYYIRNNVGQTNGTHPDYDMSYRVFDAIALVPANTTIKLTHKTHGYDYYDFLYMNITLL